MESLNRVEKSKLAKFELTEDILASLHESSSIPVNFYNKDGQALLPKKENATGDDISKLQKFEKQGIYYNRDDIESLLGNETNNPDSVNGQKVSFAKLVDPTLTIQLAKDTDNFFADLKNSGLTGSKVQKVNDSIDNILSDFSATDDVENGLVNILDVMKDADVEQHSEIVTKRTVVAMALKLRGATATSKKEEDTLKKEQMNLMLSSYMCDIGMSQLNVPEGTKLSKEDYQKMQMHPLLSYLMIANMKDIDTAVKWNVLNHHRPFKGDGLNNNYPVAKSLAQKLLLYKQKYQSDRTKSIMLHDIDIQVKKILDHSNNYDEDVNIISIAGEFASLTTDQSWRKAFEPVQAMKVILNNSFFIYNDRIMKEFFDYVGLSLCNNVSSINKGDYVIAMHYDNSKKPFFEICIVYDIFKFQTQPVLERIGTIKPIFMNEGKYVLKGFELNSIKIDKRKAHYNLATNDPRRIVYILDGELTPELHKAVHEQYETINPPKEFDGESEI